MRLAFKILLTILSCLIHTGLFGQDPYFSQFFANRLYLNPAMAGMEEFRRLSLNYRNQWPLSGNQYVTYSASYDQYVEPLHGGIGFSVYNDNQGNGIITQFGASLIYAYHLNVSRDLSINAGFQTSFVQRKLNTTHFIYGDMLNPDGSIQDFGAESTGNHVKAYPDFAFGLTAFYKNFYTGASMFHLLKPTQSLSEDPNAVLSRKLTFFSGLLIPIYERRLGKEVLQLSPNIVFIKQRNLAQINSGCEFLYKNGYLTGVWLRQNLGIRFNSLIFSAGYTHDKIRLRYSYDHQLSSPTVALPALGSHELSFILIMESSNKNKRHAIKCLKI
jgi:type IX secretion system PorP/SprF family membrane protein